MIEPSPSKKAATYSHERGFLSRFDLPSGRASLPHFSDSASLLFDKVSGYFLRSSCLKSSRSSSTFSQFFPFSFLGGEIVPSRIPSRQSVHEDSRYHPGGYQRFAAPSTTHRNPSFLNAHDSPRKTSNRQYVANALNHCSLVISDACRVAIVSERDAPAERITTVCGIREEQRGRRLVWSRLQSS